MAGIITTGYAAAVDDVVKSWDSFLPPVLQMGALEEPIASAVLAVSPLQRLNCRAQAVARCREAI